MSILDMIVGTARRLTGIQSEFRRILDPIVSQLGYKVLVSDNEALSIDLPRGAGHSPYFVMVYCFDGSTVGFQINSLMSFHNGLPPEVCMAVSDMNRRMEDYTFDLHSSKTKFHIKAQVPLYSISPRILANTINELLAHIETFDEVLTRHGFDD